jgi:fatty-acyl-CoA synthase
MAFEDKHTNWFVFPQGMFKMSNFSAKTILRKTLGFLNVGSMFRFLAGLPFRRNRVLFIFEGREYTYAQTCAESERYAALFLSVKQERIKKGLMNHQDSLAVGMYQENTPEFVFAFFGAAMSGSVLFGFNTGFRGDTLVSIINQAGTGILLVDEGSLREMERILPELNTVQKNRIFQVGNPAEEGEEIFPNIADALSTVPFPDLKKQKPGIDIFGPLIVIYTSGTTGLPKGVPCSHAKCFGAGMVTRRRIGLKSGDRGYICMPLFHSNSILLGIMPLVVTGGSFLLKRKFSAGAFEEDILAHGVTYMNYVGQPVHYILSALERKYGSGEAIVQALASHPNNRFRIAHGNGALPTDRQKLTKYLGMDHIYELYGSTEAPITTVVRPGDPPDSVGEVPSKEIVILNENDEICQPGVADSTGQLVNYHEAVGEITRKMKPDNVFFDGYFQNQSATEKKFRNGYFRSGDLGHIRMINNRRYLYFNGRTDDWIRKDGENFSAENVAQSVLNLDGVMQVAAYGVPCHVADEKVMVAVQLNGQVFDPKRFHDELMQQQKQGGMDPKWMPDFIRVLDDFPVTRTHKILIRPLKQQHFNIDRHPDMEIYFRQRGDDTYHPLTPEAFSAIREEFQKTGRLHLLERY